MAPGNEIQPTSSGESFDTLIEAIMGMRQDINMMRGDITNKMRKGGYGYGVEGNGPKDQCGYGGRDMGLNFIKVTLPRFHGGSDPKGYLKCESQCDRIFQVNYLPNVKKTTYVVAQFEGYSLTWWESAMRMQGILHGGHYPLWDVMKAPMRAKYVPERYRQGFLAKLYNLIQEYKSVESYFDEFQNLLLKFDYNEDEKHTKIRFKKVDVYGFGFILWEMLAGTIPYEDMTPVQAAYAIVNKNTRPPISGDCSPTMRTLIEQCWSLHPEKRPEFWQIVKALEQFESSVAHDETLNLVQNSMLHHKKGFIHWIQKLGSSHQNATLKPKSVS
ncbi:hypothetical protein BC332_18500 [Capsicum chinense]|nr:hypothetical protein BC332_18500 [Capsicum chinense]